MTHPEPANPTISQPGPGVFQVGGPSPNKQLPEDGPTTGYALNHFMLRIRNPDRSLYFYKTLLGMRSIFTFNGGPFTIYYLGYPTTEADRSDPAAWASRLCSGNISRTPGLLELKHIHGSEKPIEEGGYEISNGNEPPNMGFGHLGFSVPDVHQAVVRLRAAGVKVIKDLNTAEREHIPLTEWEENRGVGIGELHPAYKEGFCHVAFVQDPVCHQ